MDIELPAAVRERATSNGAAGRRWLTELPDRVADLTERWQLTLGAPFTGGTASYVVAATTAAGSQCVLKVAMPLDMDERDTVDRAVRAHVLADGRGCARLLDHDGPAAAMLLERLGPNLADRGTALPDVLRTIAETLRTFWRPVPADAGLRSGADQAAWLVRYIETTWEALGRPCDREVIDRAVLYAERRAAGVDASRAVLVHGDAHGWNTLDAGDGTCKFVDPEGLRSEPEHDLAVPMREYNEPLLRGDTPRLVRERAAFLAHHAGADPDLVWEWGFVERVSTGLANLHDFADGDGDAFLEVARRCLRA